MSDCAARAEEVVALALGETPEGDGSATRAHVAACPACARLHADARRVFDLGQERYAPDPFAGLGPARRRALAADIVDGAMAEAGEAPRGPILRLADGVRVRYAESRAVRFFALSATLHAAAAAFLGAWLYLSPQSPLRRVDGTAGGILVGEADGPRLEGGGPAAVTAPPGLRIPGAERLPFPADPGLGAAAADPRPPFDPGVEFQSFPTEEFREFAGVRFRPALRDRRLAAAWGEEGAPRTAQAVQRGLRWLAYDQAADGGWDRARGGGATAEAVRAFLADGATPLRRGPWAPAVRAGVDALVRSQDPVTGLLGGEAGGVGHGPALAALAEAYGLDFALLGDRSRSGMAEVLRRSVAASRRLQHADGSFPARPGGPGDAGATLLHAEGLVVARMAGIPVEGDVLRRAASWLEGRVGEDGRLGGADPTAQALLTARAWALSDGLGLDGDVRGRLRRAVLADAGREEFRQDVPLLAGILEGLVASREPGLPGDRGSSLAAAALAAAAGDAFPRRAGGSAPDAAATAAALRAFFAPLRTSAP